MEQIQIIPAEPGWFVKLIERCTTSDGGIEYVPFTYPVVGWRVLIEPNKEYENSPLDVSSTMPLVIDPTGTTDLPNETFLLVSPQGIWYESDGMRVVRDPEEWIQEWSAFMMSLKSNWPKQNAPAGTS